jgi:hypothetical protein
LNKHIIETDDFRMEVKLPADGNRWTPKHRELWAGLQRLAEHFATPVRVEQDAPAKERTGFARLLSLVFWSPSALDRLRQIGLVVSAGAFLVLVVSIVFARADLALYDSEYHAVTQCSLEAYFKGVTESDRRNVRSACVGTYATSLPSFEMAACLNTSARPGAVATWNECVVRSWLGLGGAR